MNSGKVWLGVAGTALFSLVASGVLVGPNLLLLVLAGWCLIGVIGTLWQSVQNLSAQTELTLEDALHLGAPSAIEQRKQAVLRALKDLEYERGVGKISREDYLELSQQYRAQARELMQELDKNLEPARRAVERRIAEHLEGGSSSASPALDAPREVDTSQDEIWLASDASAGTSKPDTAPASATSAAAVNAVVACAKCGTVNDGDARFCKRCGVALASQHPVDDSVVPATSEVAE